MARKHLKFLMVLSMLALLSGVIFLYVSDKAKHPSQEKTNHFSTRNKKDLTIRGFRFNGIHEGRKAITIKAAKFSVEKKKIGIFRLSPLRAARFRGAEVDLYLNNIQSADGLIDQKHMIVKGLFSEETMPVSAFKGATSIVFEPIKINFYLDDRSVTEIHARKATLDPRRRRVVLQGKILATSALNQLSTERLLIYPEKGIIEVNDKFVLKTENRQVNGEKLTADLFLKKADGQQNL